MFMLYSRIPVVSFHTDIPSLMMYYLATIFAAALAIFSGAHAQGTTTLSYDQTYDNKDLSLNQVACSDGVNGLETKYPGYTTLGSIPSFPNVGGVFNVTGYNSPACGTCYAVTYRGKTINVVAVDRATAGFVISEEAMNNLTNGQAIALGRVDVSYAVVSASACRLPY